jgi:DNA-binding beta-propeller fold protein YncE
MTVTPDGAWLFAASYDGAWTRLHIIRTSDNQVTDTIVLMHGSVVSDAECSPDGRKVYVAARKLFVVDAVERRLVDSIPLETYALAFSPDGRELYAAGEFRLSVLQTANDSVVADIPFCQFPSAMVMHPDGQRLYVADEAGQRVLVVDTRARTIAATVLLPTTWPWALALASEGRLLYVAGNGLSVVNTKNNVCTDVLPFAEVAGFGLSTCARYIYYSVYNRDGILVLDTRQRVVVDTIARGIGAGSTISLPDGTRAYAEGFGGLRELTFGVWGSTVSIEK